MSFDVAALHYQRFMGRYADSLAAAFLPRLQLRDGQRALDVGAGTGALTEPLVGLLGAGAVAAIEPSPQFAEALGRRLPGTEIRRASAESIPFPNGSFDLAVAQLVVHFMADPVLGITEMARVTKPGGTVAATVWDFAGGRSPLSLFWSAVGRLDAAAADESDLPGARAGHLVELFQDAGLDSVGAAELDAAVPYRDFDDWWEPYTLGVGPAGAYVASLSSPSRERLRLICRELLPVGPGVVAATAWMASGRRR